MVSSRRGSSPHPQLSVQANPQDRCLPDAVVTRSRTSTRSHFRRSDSFQIVRLPLHFHASGNYVPSLQQPQRCVQFRAVHVLPHRGLVLAQANTIESSIPKVQRSGTPVDAAPASASEAHQLEGLLSVLRRAPPQLNHFLVRFSFQSVMSTQLPRPDLPSAQILALPFPGNLWRSHIGFARD